MATRIVFLGSGRRETLALVVDQQATNVGSQVADGKLARLTHHAKPIWVNLSNVLFMEEAEEGESGFAFF